MLDAHPVGHLTALLRAERDLARARRAGDTGDPEAEESFRKAVAAHAATRVRTTWPRRCWTTLSSWPPPGNRTGPRMRSPRPGPSPQPWAPARSRPGRPDHPGPRLRLADRVGGVLKPPQNWTVGHMVCLCLTEEGARVEVTCGACGAQNSVTGKFCSECGTALATACPACGIGVSAGQKFCSECGARIVAAGGGRPG